MELTREALILPVMLVSLALLLAMSSPAPVASAPIATPTATATPFSLSITVAFGQVTVTLGASSIWDTGFCMSGELHNAGDSAVSNWVLSFRIASGIELTSVWESVMQPSLSAASSARCWMQSCWPYQWTIPG